MNQKEYRAEQTAWMVEAIKKVALSKGVEGENWEELTRVVNIEGLRAYGDKAWTVKTLKSFCKKNGINFGTLPQAAESDAMPADTEKKGPVVIQGRTPVLHLNESVTADIIDMLEWWKTHKEGLTMLMKSGQEIETRPTFRRDKTATKTVRLSAQLVERAEREARRQKALSGGSLSGLVELLLWRFLGCPDDLIVLED